MSEVVSPVPPPGSPAPGINRAVYGMPMFATLLATDLDATVSWYVDGLDFVVLFTLPGPPGGDGPALVHLRRWQFQDLLVRPVPEARSPGTGLTLSFAAAYGEIDALAERARAHAGGHVDGPVDTRWNTRDLTATDPDGAVVVFTAARPRLTSNVKFDQQMRRWSREQGLDPKFA
jgi:hypothetical protein